MSLRTIIRHWIYNTADSTLVQLFRYFFVGGLAFIVDFSTLFALTHYASLHYLISAAIAFLLGLTTNYLISVRWVFHQRKLASAKAEFIIFGAIGLAGLAMNEIIMWVCTDRLVFHYLASKIIATGVVFFFNFFVRKLALFKV